MTKAQFELGCACEAFNLAAETGVDPERVLRERRETIERQRQAAAFEAKMQRSLAECPGVVGFDAPNSPDSKGKVVVEPAHTVEAFQWLKRRFHVAENLELSGAVGLVFEIAPRRRGLRSNGKRIKVHFGKVEQFELGLS